MNKYLLILLFVLANNINVFSQKDYTQLFYEAFINSDMITWKNLIDEMQLNQQFRTNYSELDKELLIAQYGYIAYCIGTDNREEAEKYIQIAKNNFQKIIVDNEHADFYAIISTIYGFEMYLSQFKAVYLLYKIFEYQNKALQNENSIFVMVERANLLFFTPNLLGGNQTEAIILYEKAASTYKEDSLYVNSWYYLNLLRHLAQIYEKNEDYDKAQNLYKYIIEREPNFKWVNNELYPAFLKKINH